MSGAEVLAIVGGVAAFAGLLKNAKDTVSWIRLGPSGELLSMEICEVELRCELLSELLASLHKIGVNLEGLQSKPLRDVTAKISRQVHDLQDLVNLEESLKRARKRDRMKLAIKQPARSTEMQKLLLGLDRNLDLVYKIFHILTLSRLLPTAECASQSGPVILNTAVNSEPLQGMVEISQTSQQLEPLPIQPRARYKYSQTVRRSQCSRGTCPCQCHHTGSGGRGHLRFQGSTWASLFTPCSCNSKVFSWIITAFKQQLSFSVSIENDRGYSLSSSLRPYNTVPNTSPLFLVLYKCRLGYIDFDTALLSIRKIISSGAGSLSDVNRWGENFFMVCKTLSLSGIQFFSNAAFGLRSNFGLQQLISTPWDASRIDIQFALLEHFMAEGTPVDVEMYVHSIYKRHLLIVGYTDSFWGLSTGSSKVYT
jgi:hypothetical protein